MINIKRYCVASNEYGTVLNEKASISSRGLFERAWMLSNRVTGNTSILALHVNARNEFVEGYAHI